MAHYLWHSIEPNLKLANSLIANKDCHLVVNTAIKDNGENGYRLIIRMGSEEIITNKPFLDTTLRVPVSEIAIELKLPDFYLTSHPPARFSKLSTSKIDLQKADFITIDLPIFKDYFYYSDFGIINISDKGKYYLINNRKIKKENE